MTREEFLLNLQESYQTCIDIVKKKNQDYSKDIDPFSNFRAISTMLGRPSEEVIMMFIVNKISRATNLLHRENAVKDEGIEDTILDCINYLAILRAYLHSEKKQSST